MTRVLVVDDEPQIVRALSLNLRARGLEAVTATTGQEALHAAREHQPDLVILDLGLPDLDGRSVIAELRTWTRVPIIVLSGRTDQVQKIAALDAGADDYIAKPFGIDELFARVRAASRRFGQSARPTASLGGWVIDLAAHRVRGRLPGTPDQHLTPTEWKILETLVGNPGRLVTRAQLLLDVWGSDHDPDTSSLRLYIAQLRRKLEPVPNRPRFLLTEPGLGYRLVPDVESFDGT